MPNEAGDATSPTGVPHSRDRANGEDARPLIGVLALQGAFQAHCEILGEIGVRTRQVRRNEDLEGLSGIVVPGGESTTMSNLLVTSGLLERLATLIDEGLAVFGTCAGMILLADRIVDGRDDQISLRAMDIVVRRNAYGRQVDSFETSIRVTGLDDPFPAVFIRAPSIESIGHSVEVLAVEGSRPCLVRQGRLLAASFHPELTGDTRVHRLFLSIVQEKPMTQESTSVSDAPTVPSTRFQE